MKAVTLWQPWASLIAIGAKTIETRSWAAPKSLIGQRIAIHAAVASAGIDSLPGDCEGNWEAGWRYGFVGAYQAGYCHRSSDEGRRGDTFMVKAPGDYATDDERAAPAFDGSLPLGAIVCFARLVDCVPMVAPHEVADERPVLAAADHLTLWQRHRPGWPYERGAVLDDQLPYGDFAPGRFAWLLEDIDALNPPVSATGRQGVWEWTP